MKSDEAHVQVPTRACIRRWSSSPRNSAPRPPTWNRRSSRFEPATIARFLAQSRGSKSSGFISTTSSVVRPTPEPTVRNASWPVLPSSPMDPERFTASVRPPISPIPTITLSDGTRVDSTMLLQHSSRVTGPRRPRRGDVDLLLGAWPVSGDVRCDAERAGPERRVLTPARGSTTARCAAALDVPNIPVSVYKRLVDGVNRHLPTFHRYLKLRRAGC